MFWARKRARGSGEELEDGEESRDSAQANVETSRGGEAPREDEADEGDEPGPLEPSARLTGHQFLYIFVVDGLGGMAISGGINFAIAYAMYTTQDTQRRHPIRLFELPNTLAGDAAVTIVVQCLLTWFIEMALVAHDLAERSVQPVGFVREPARPWVRWLLMLGPSGEGPRVLSPGEADGAPGPGAAAGREAPDREVASGSGSGAPGPEEEAAAEARNRVNWRKWRSRALSLAAGAVQQAMRALLIAVAAFAVLWPPAVGILTAVGTRSGGDWVFGDRWAPQVFKLVLGGTLGLLTAPVMALFWLVRAGWEATPRPGAGGEAEPPGRINDSSPDCRRDSQTGAPQADVTAAGPCKPGPRIRGGS